MNENKIFEKLDKFEKNWSKKNPDKVPGYCHNKYYIVSEDRDGNITNEAFAMNCMTDYAMNSVFVQEQSLYSQKLYIGQGTNIPTPDSASMTSFIPNGTAYSSSVKREYQGCRFYRDTGLLVSNWLIITGYYDYTQFDENKTVTEIGIGENTTSLLLHARVYDEQGDPSSFVKKMNEKLTVYVYSTFSCKIADIFNRNIAKGIISVFNPATFLKFDSNSDGVSKLSMIMLPDHNGRYRSWLSRNVYNGTDFSRDFTNNIATSTRASNFIDAPDNGFFDGKYTYISEMYIGTHFDTERYQDYYFGGNVLMLQPMSLSSPEKIECENLFTDNYNTTNFTKIFGHGTDNRNYRIDGHIPAIDFDISGTGAGVWMYNCQTKDWDIAETFVNAKNTKYTGEYIQWSIIMRKQYIDFYNEQRDYRVYINTRPDVPITAMELSGSVVYATDTYWDPQSWVQISNLSSIDLALQTKRFYIILGDGKIPYSSNYPIGQYGENFYRFRTQRAQPAVHSITPTNPYSYCDYGEDTTNDHNTRTTKAVAGDTYGYIAMEGWIIYPDTNDPNGGTNTDASATDNHFWYRYPIKSLNDERINSRFIWNTSDGNIVVTQGESGWVNGFRVFTVNIDPTIAPTYQDFLFTDIGGEAWNSSSSYRPHWSESGTGFVAMSYISGDKNVNKTYVVDMYGGQNNDTPEMYCIDGYKCANIVGSTNYICGINTSILDHLSLDVIDMKTKQVVRTIDIPSGYDFAGMAGFDNFIYIRTSFSGAITTYLYRIDVDELTATDLDYTQMIIDGSSYYRHIQLSAPSNGNCESCMVMLANDRTKYEYSILFKSSDPTRPIRLIDDGTNTDTCRSSMFGNIKYVNNNKQLVMSFVTQRCLVADIGRIIDKGTQPNSQTVKYQYPRDDDRSRYTLCIYKGRVMFITPHIKIRNYTVRTRLESYPLESWIPHKIVGYTNTINTYNNPKIVNDGKNITVQISNVETPQA